MIHAEGMEIQDHVKLLQTQKAVVDNLSDSAMTDETWRGIIIWSIPPMLKWLPVTPSLYAITSLADIILTLFAHGMIIGRVTASTNSTSTALAARMTDGCTNLNCKAKKRSTHTTTDCYWLGGGKEGQFPPNFGQRNQVNAASITMNIPATGSSTSNQPEHFVLLAQVTNTPGESGVLIDGEQSSMALISQGFQKFQKGKIPAFMDLGASNTMFVSRESFNDYKLITSCTGDSAKAVDENFDLTGKGTVIHHYRVDSQEQDITYTQALHMPTLNANLISISTFDRAGLTMTFGDGKGIVWKSDGTIILTGQNVSGMYLPDVIDNVPKTPLAMTSLSQPMSPKQWDQRFSHCSPLMIQGMANKNLVDGLNVSNGTINRKCEDCILGQQTHCPFNGVI